MKLVIQCQVCSRKLAFLDLAPGMSAQARCPACDAVTVATVDRLHHVELVTSESVPRPVRSGGRR